MKLQFDLIGLLLVHVLTSHPHKYVVLVLGMMGQALYMPICQTIC